MIDTSLLEKERPITLDDLKANFQANDFSAYSSGFGDKKRVERTERFQKICAYFEAAWSDQMKVCHQERIKKSRQLPAHT